jgi:hypothetical protein
MTRLLLYTHCGSVKLVFYSLLLETELNLLRKMYRMAGL